MQFKIHCAHRESGRDMSVIIEAPTPSAAEEQANAMNIMVERIDVVAPTKPAPVAVHQVDQHRGPQPGTAAVLSLLIPGAGQMYKGKTLEGFLWLIAVPLGYLFFILPGLILHLMCIVSAGSTGVAHGRDDLSDRKKLAFTVVTWGLLLLLGLVFWLGFR